MDVQRTPGRYQSAAVLLEQAAAGLAEAGRGRTPAGRFAPARLAALRAATAVVATRAESSCPSPARPRSVWVLLASVAPELREWSAFFAACAEDRRITMRDADDMVRQAEQFLVLARGAAAGTHRRP